MRLLLVEDEKRMGTVLSEILRLEKYEVDLKSNGISGLEAVQSGVYDLIILDVMLPGKSGFEIARQARIEGIKTPILMLTALEEPDDKVNGLDSGADDYLTKPFNTKELLARIRALIRRTVGSYDDVLTFKDLSLNTSTYTLSCNVTGQSLRLREKEYRIIEYMLSNRNQVLSREQLALRIWGYENDAEYNNVEVYLSFTRKKLAFIGSEVEIKAVRGLGYELR